MRALRSAAAVTASLALLIGVPWLLSHTIGNPLTRLPDLLAGDLNDHVVLAALAAILYLAWAQFAVAFAVELISAIRRTPMPPSIPGVFAAQQGLARALVGAALLLLPMTASTLVPAAQAIALSPAHHPATAVSVLDPDPAVTGLATAAPVVPTREIVLTDDGARTWWDLAHTHLGDGAGWRDIWDLNRARVQPDGTVLATERVVLQPGWIVAVPDATVTGPALPPAAGAATADDGRAVEVTVRLGDTLSEIAAEHGVDDWTTVWPSNAGREEPEGARYTDPDHIEPGWTVTIPTPAEPGDNTGAASGEGDNPDGSSVDVMAGETLSQIAADNGIPLEAVVAANTGRVQPDGSQLVDPDHIRPGWQIVIPRTTPQRTSPPPNRT
jgi:nucleoid-associated protein YgaU